MGRRAFKLVPLLIMVATIGLGATWAHADGNQVPFRGSWSGAVVFTGPTTAVFDGTGVATHLGLGTNHGIATITGTDASCPGGLANTNVETLTGANGDSIQIASSDVTCPIAPGVTHGHGQYVVTGGTGRFAGATGGGILDGVGDFVDGTFWFTATGTISAPTQG